jgi:hypothetical protein
VSSPWDRLTFFDSGPAVTRKAVEKVSQRLRLPFPPLYVDFLVARNGGVAVPQKFPIRGCKRDTHGYVQVFYRVEELADQARTFRRRMPPGLLPIANDPGGNLICLACEGSGKRPGRVFFWEMEFEADTGEGETVGWRNLYHIADNFGAFLRALEPDPEWDADVREWHEE